MASALTQAKNLFQQALGAAAKATPVGQLYGAVQTARQKAPSVASSLDKEFQKFQQAAPRAQQAVSSIPSRISSFTSSMPKMQMPTFKAPPQMPSLPDISSIGKNIPKFISDAKTTISKSPYEAVSTRMPIFSKAPSQIALDKISPIAKKSFERVSKASDDFKKTELAKQLDQAPEVFGEEFSKSMKSQPVYQLASARNNFITLKNLPKEIKIIFPQLKTVDYADEISRKMTGKSVVDHIDTMLTEANKQNEVVERRKDINYKYQDPRFWAQGIGNMLPSMITSVAVSGAVSALTGGNVALGAIAGLGSSYALTSGMEGGASYLQAKKEGATDEQARLTARITGNVNALIEVFPFGRMISKLPAGEIFMKKLEKNLTTELIKHFLKEGGQEGVQEIVSNVAKRVYDENAPLLTKSVLDSFLIGGITGAGTKAVEGVRPGFNTQDINTLTTEEKAAYVEKLQEKKAEVVAQISDLYDEEGNVTAGKESKNKELVSMLEDINAQEQRLAAPQVTTEAVAEDKPSVESVGKFDPETTQKLSKNIQKADAKFGDNSHIELIGKDPNTLPPEQQPNVVSYEDKRKDTTKDGIDIVGEVVGNRHRNGDVVMYTIDAPSKKITVQPSELRQQFADATASKFDGRRISELTDAEQVAAVESGVKPVSSATSESNIDTKLPRLEVRFPDKQPGVSEYIYYRPETKAVAEEVRRLLEMPQAKVKAMGDKYHRALGEFYGYSDTEIEEFIAKNNKQKEEKNTPVKKKRALPKTVSKEIVSDIEKYVDSKGIKLRVADDKSLVIPSKTQGITSKFLEHSDVKGKDRTSYSFLMNLSKSDSFGLKTKEREIIQEVLNKQFLNEKNIDMNEFRDAVIRELLPVEVIRSGTYASYGADNVRLGNLDHTTYILNSPFEHGKTGHFSADFKKYVTPDSVEIKEIPVQASNPRAKFAVVNKNVELTQENIEQNVHTLAISKEEAQKWIDDHVVAGKDAYNGLAAEGTPTLSLVTQGLFASVRTFDDRSGSEDGDVAHIAEIQSDVYQHGTDDIESGARQKNLQERVDNIKKDIENARNENALDPRLQERLKEAESWLERAKKEAQEPSKEEKLYLGYKNIWHERAIREAINIKANEGFKVLRFPTPRTVSFIEGFSSDNSDGEFLPYEIVSADDHNQLEVGDTIDYGGEEMTVLEADGGEIKVAPSDKVSHFDHDEAVQEDIDNRWADARSNFEDIEKDLGPINTAEKAESVVRKYDYLNQLAKFSAMESDIKMATERYDNSESRQQDKMIIEAGNKRLEAYKKFEKLLKDGVIEKENITFGNIHDIPFKDALEEKYSVPHSFWNYILDGYGLSDDLPFETVKENTLRGIVAPVERVKGEIENAKDALARAEKQFKDEILLIKLRTAPTKEDLSGIPENVIEGAKISKYGYSLDWEAEKILDLMSARDSEEEFTLDDIEEDFKNAMSESYESDYEGIYGNGNVFFQDKGYNNQEVWVVNEGRTETFMQPDQYETNSSPEDFDINNFGGNQKTVLQFYDKQVIPYLKKIRKENLKEITDDNGYTWMETKVTQDDLKPATAYRIKDDLKKVGIRITNKQEAEIVKLNAEIFGDASVKITEQILANNKALGSYREGIIKILSGQSDPTDTFYHEAVHKYLDIFTDRTEHIELLKAAQLKYQIRNISDVEERLAEDFIKYAKSRRGVFGKMKIIFDKMLQRIKSFLGNNDKIEELYSNIISGKAKTMEAAQAIDPEDIDAMNTTIADNINDPVEIQAVYDEMIAMGKKMPPLEEMVEKIKAEGDKAISEGKADALANSISKNPGIAQFAKEIRQAYGSWMRNQDQDIDGLTIKFPGLDSALEALRETGVDIVEPSQLKNIFYALPKISKQERMSEVRESLKSEANEKKVDIAKKQNKIDEKKKIIETEEFSDETGTPKEIYQGKKSGMKERKYYKSLTSSPQITQELYDALTTGPDSSRFYKNQGMDTVFKPIFDEIMGSEEGMNKWVATVLDDTAPIGMERSAAAYILSVVLPRMGLLETARQVGNKEIRRATQLGREIKGFDFHDQIITPENAPKFVLNEIDEVKKEIRSQSKGEGELFDGTEAAAKDITKQISDINIEVAPVVAKQTNKKFGDKIAQAKKNIAKEIGEKEEEIVPEEQLADRIVEYVKKAMAEPKEKEIDPIKMMVDELYKVAKESDLPEVAKPKALTDYDFIREAMRQRGDEYRVVWETAKESVRELVDSNDSLSDEQKEQAYEMLDTYFEHVLDLPFSKKRLNRVMRAEAKDLEYNIGKIVQEYYIEAQDRAGKNLAAVISEKTGLGIEDSIEIEKYVIAEFTQLTATKKQALLDTFFNKYQNVLEAAEQAKNEAGYKVSSPEENKKTFFDRITRLSNLGAFSDSKYYDAMADHIGIPNVSLEMMTKVDILAQELQKTESISEKNKIKQKIFDLIAMETPIGFGDMIQTYRYGNMLSGPRTHLRNAYANSFQLYARMPVELMMENFLRMANFNKEKIAGQEFENNIRFNAPKYSIGVMKALIGATKRFIEVFREGSMESKFEGSQIRLAELKRRKMFLTKSKQNKLFTQIPLAITSAMEASDAFFFESAREALETSLSTEGMTEEQRREFIDERVREMLLRGKIDPGNKTGQGSIYATADMLMNLLMRGRNSKFFGQFIQHIIPFVMVPYNYAKLESQTSLLGSSYYTASLGARALANTKLAKKLGVSKQIREMDPLEGISEAKKTTLQARGMLGGAILPMIGLTMGMMGKATWAPPEDEEAQKLFYESGRIPYAIEMNGYWIPIAYFPGLTWGLASGMAAYYYMKEKRTAPTDSGTRIAMNTFMGMAKMYTDSTFLSNVSDFMALISGSKEIDPEKFGVGLVSQYIPLAQMNKFITSVIDPVYRRTKGVAQAFGQYGWITSAGGEARLDMFGQERKRDFFSTWLPYGVGTNKDIPSYLFREKSKLLQQYTVITSAVNRLAIPENIKDEADKMEYTYQHPEVLRGAQIKAYKNDLGEIYKKRVETLTDKSLTPEMKKDMLGQYDEEEAAIIRDIDEEYKQAQIEMGESPDGVKSEMNFINEGNGLPQDEIGFNLKNNPVQLPSVPDQANNIKLLTDKVKAAESDSERMAEAQNFAENMNLPMTKKEVIALGKSIDNAKKMGASAEKVQQVADDFFSKLKTMNDSKTKYESLRKTVRVLNEKSIELLRKRAPQYGIKPDDMEYDLWSSREFRERKLYVYDQIANETGENIFKKLASMRLQSPGTGKMILTEEIISDLVDDGVLSKQQGTQLRKLTVTGGVGNYTVKASASSSGGSFKSKVGDMPVFKLPAPPKIKTIKISAPKAKKISIMPPKITVASTGVQAPTYKKLLKFKKVNLLRVR